MISRSLIRHLQPTFMQILKAYLFLKKTLFFPLRKLSQYEGFCWHKIFCCHVLECMINQQITRVNSLPGVVNLAGFFNSTFHFDTLQFYFLKWLLLNHWVFQLYQFLFFPTSINLVLTLILYFWILTLFVYFNTFNILLYFFSYYFYFTDICLLRIIY